MGLLQGSTAVVIGAMLVAPLMGPLLAAGHSLVQGHLQLFRFALRSALEAPSEAPTDPETALE
jgi:uncharacterized membrane protein